MLFKDAIGINENYIITVRPHNRFVKYFGLAESVMALRNKVHSKFGMFFNNIQGIVR